MRSSCWAIWRFRMDDSGRRGRHTGGSWRTIPRIHSRWCIPIRRLSWRGLRPRSCCAGLRRGRIRLARADLSEFRRRYPGATGALAGRKGGYAEIVAEALELDSLGPPRERGNRWPTFAGSFERTRIVPAAIDVGSLQWKVDLEKVSVSQAPVFNPRTGMGGNPVTVAQERLLAYHPIVLGDQVIVCDGFRVQAFNLNDRPQEGENSTPRLINPVWKYPPDDDPTVPHVRPGGQGIPRYTLTAAGNKILRG